MNFVNNNNNDNDNDDNNNNDIEMLGAGYAGAETFD